MANGLKFGIDLGTTFSSIGYYDHSTRQIRLANLDCENGSYLLPSAVYVKGPNDVIVGTQAVHAGLEKPERLFRWFKRDLGIVEPDPANILDGKQWTPFECSIEVLKKLKQEAELAFATEVKDVVITFPAFFNNRQKDLTGEAAQEAGLNVIRMIEEPQAAALAYVIDNVLQRADLELKDGDLGSIVPHIIQELAGGKRAVLVYDLGGGTFDVAMIQANGIPRSDGNVELRTKTLYNDGDISLGGKDWDDIIKDIVRKIDQEQNSHDPMSDPQPGRLDEECERAKKNLKNLDSTTIVCQRLHQIQVTRQQVEQATKHKLDDTENITRTVLAYAEKEFGVKRDDVTILLCGGMTRWPPVEPMLIRVMDGRPPLKHKNVDYLVTYGGAYLAYLSVVAEEREVRQRPGTEPQPPRPEAAPSVLTTTTSGPGGLVVLEDGIQVPYPAIGVEVVDPQDPTLTRMQVKCVMPSKSTSGAFAEEVFGLVYDGQREVEIKIRFLKEREHGRADQDTDLDAWEEYKTFHMTLSSPRPKGHRIHVELRYEEGGVIRGKAYDDTGDKIDIVGSTRKHK